MRVKVYGERNTGTQLMREILLGHGIELWPGTIAELGMADRLEALQGAAYPEGDGVLIREAVIDDMFAEAFTRTLGWKHGLPDLARLPSAASDTRFVMTVKNPYAWVVSMARRPHHNLLRGNRGSIESFLASPWITCDRDNAPHHLGSVVELWTVKYRAWLAMGARWPVTIIRYEDLLLRPATLPALAAWLDAGSRRPWQLPTQVPNNVSDLAFYQDHYAKERWRDALSPRCIELINARLDRDLMEALGYPVLSGAAEADHGGEPLGGSGEMAIPAAS